MYSATPWKPPARAARWKYGCKKRKGRQPLRYSIPDAAPLRKLPAACSSHSLLASRRASAWAWWSHGKWRKRTAAASAGFERKTGPVFVSRLVRLIHRVEEEAAKSQLVRRVLV